MPPRLLINDDGAPFETVEVQTLRNELDALDDVQRKEYRDQNAASIAQHDASKLLIVSGPGTGKSHLFLDRIKQWYRLNPDAKVFVTSFVRKLVADLQNDIDTDTDLTAEQKRHIDVSTLHRFARSIVERNRGTSEWRFKRHFRIIGPSWKEIVWSDVLAFYPELNNNDYAWKNFEKQLHNAVYEQSQEWQTLKKYYFKLCKFFNAAGFADLIVRAIDALIENPELRESDYFIIDEYQDFNSAEDALINLIVGESNGLLVVGDDEQVLYEKLKSGKPTLIRTRYREVNFIKAMLPFCGRNSYHITKTAGHFIQLNRDEESIEKIYLPFTTGDANPKVQIIACATPQTAVDYIARFISENREAIEERKNRLADGQEKDAFLLILTPAKEVNFYLNAKEIIMQIVAQYQTANRKFTEDYYKILTYYSLANYPQNNLTFRKVLYYETVVTQKMHELIERAMQYHQNLCDLEVEEILQAKQKCNVINSILEEESRSIEEKIDEIARHITINDRNELINDIARKSINQEELTIIEHEEEEEAELEEIEADHVIIIGFDDVNLHYITKNAFYVAMTRARNSLHLLTALQSGGANQAHHFLDQLPDAHLEYSKYKKQGHAKSQLPSKQRFKDHLNYLKRIQQGQ
jgi:superfamily I DNA/RNA helicase